MSATSGTTTPGAQSLNRTRSSRTATPVSARAAARRPAASNEPDDEVKAEMQVKYDELQEQLRLADERSTQVQRQAAVLQIKLDEALKEQGLLEESVHEQVEKVNDLENERKESLRARREMEQIYESERSAAMKEREEAQTQQEDMQASMQRLKEALHSREVRAGLDDERRPSLSRNSSFRNSGAPSPNPEMTSPFAPPATLQRSDSRSSSKLVMQKDKIIESLRLELAEAHIKLVELDNMGGGRLQKLEAEMYEVKMQNARLMEENESFQLLLSEKTLNGDFGQSDLLRPRSNNGSRPPSRHPQGDSLADELEGHDETETSEDSRRLHAEVSSLKDQNKALTLYINNIISRLLQHDQFEQILDKTPDIFSSGGAASSAIASPAKPQEKALPAPPPTEQDDEAPSGFLQRARSVMGAKRPRPQSQIFPSTHTYTELSSDQPTPRPNEDPSTAPQVPLGRRAVSGGQSAHRRSNSEWAGGANLVNQMYRPTPSAAPSGLGPASPGLSSPTSTRTSFFGAPPGPASRVPSGSTVPTISSIAETSDAKAPQRDSKVPAPSSDPSAPTDEATLASNPSSPPRSLNSSGESSHGGRGNGGAIIVGSKMRPLRLVREAEESRGGSGAGAGGAGNRASWFGWMNKGALPGMGGEAGKGGSGQ
ncbi:hypothetical protein B0A48_12277 [Cryoendolithus antarcticus]|uniref:Uncharacterized protein n=1 Tax=Cryoendolithus antarcticus TaxID=1507870 RepID=A0A1V8SS19_9PEZI|nr:hypothetical protein B0A48_12277 [Cryoendolithus antarcticus]